MCLNLQISSGYSILFFRKNDRILHGPRTTYSTHGFRQENSFVSKTIESGEQRLRQESKEKITHVI